MAVDRFVAFVNSVLSAIYTFYGEKVFLPLLVFFNPQSRECLVGSDAPKVSVDSIRKLLAFAESRCACCNDSLHRTDILFAALCDAKAEDKVNSFDH